MPNYEWKCRECGRVFERFRARPKVIYDAAHMPRCPVCTGDCKQHYSTPPGYQSMTHEERMG